jgi:hypothetical protein
VVVLCRLPVGGVPRGVEPQLASWDAAGQPSQAALLFRLLRHRRLVGRSAPMADPHGVTLPCESAPAPDSNPAHGNEHGRIRRLLSR